MADESIDNMPTRNVTIFDLDHTISKRDTYLQFLLVFLRAHPLRVLRCVFLPMAVCLHKLKYRDNTWLKETFLKAIAGGAEQNQVNRISNSFIGGLLHSGLYADALQRIRQHKNDKDVLILASASFDFYVDRLAAELGFDQVICTRAQWDQGGRLTGRIDGCNCYGEFKKTVTQQALQALGDIGKVTVYSDHHSDMPVFSLADQAVAINPTGKLKKLAAVNNLSIEHWN